MPSHPELATPRLGLCTALFLTLLGLVCLITWQMGARSQPMAWWIPLLHATILWTGVTITVTICFCGEFVIGRWATGAVLLIAHAWWLNYISMYDFSLLRYFWLFGTFTGLIVLESRVSGMPAWRLGWQANLGRSGSPIQFSIRSLMILTAVTALAISIQRIYPIKDTLPTMYFVFLFALIWFLAASTMLARRHFLWRLICLIAVVALGTVLVVWMANYHFYPRTYSPGLREFLDSLFSESNRWIWMRFLGPAGFTCCICIIYALARVDQLTFESLHRRSHLPPSEPSVSNQQPSQPAQPSDLSSGEKL